MDDLISRKEAVEEIMSEPTDAHYPDWYAKKIEALPSAQPKRMRGRWIQLKGLWGGTWECSRCGKLILVLGKKPRQDCCPNCGADMREEQTHD